jgi:hypothetical protein
MVRQDDYKLILYEGYPSRLFILAAEPVAA